MEYSINKVETGKDSLTQILNLLNLSFPKATKFNIQYLKWQYADNPLGEIVGFNAFYKDALAAHYVTMPIEMSIYGEKRRGLLSLNTATHPEHRGKRLFSILADKTYSYAAEHGYDYVIGVANANSTHGFLKNLGFYLISPLLVRIGLSSDIYSNISKPCLRIWDENTLQWRLSNPSAQYFSSKNVIFGNRGPAGVKLIMGHTDYTLQLPEPSPIRPVNLYIGLGADLADVHYYSLPQFIKHSPFNLIFKDLTGGTIPKISSDDILFQLIDFDVA